jgi:hypothetical protein
MSGTGRVGVFPGSFNPPTTAHLAIALAAAEQRHLDLVVLVHSPRVLGKAEVERPLFDHRRRVLEAAAAEHPGLRAAVTDHRLMVDIARGYDVVIMGADKWHQIQDPVWYGDDPAARDRAVAGLPDPAVAPRPPLPVPAELALDLPDDVVGGVSSTGARSGRLELMAAAARRFAEESGAWIDPERYERYLTGLGAQGLIRRW